MSTGYLYRDRKMVCVVSDALEAWQAMNVVGHLAVSLGANKDSELMGRPVLKDSSNVDHKGIARYGLVIKKGSPTDLRKIVEVARSDKSVLFIDFPREMLDTSHDDELSDWLSNRKEEDIEYLGVIVYGPSEAVNAIAKDLPLYD